MSQETASRHGDIDTMRGAACLLLVFYHVVGISPDTGLHLASDHLLAQFNAVLVYFRMPLFAFIAGIVYAQRPVTGDYRAFAAGKFRRLIVPMLVVGTVFAVLQSLAKRPATQTVDWRLLHIVPVAHYWFLESMFIVLLVVAAVDLAGGLATAWRAAALTGLLALLSVGQVVEGFPYFGVPEAAYLAPYVVAGLWFARYGPTLDRLGAGGLMALCMGILAAATLKDVELPDKQALLPLVAGLGFCVALASLHLKAGWLEYVGEYSFPIFLFHSIFSSSTRAAVAWVFGGRAGVTVHTALGLAAGVFLSVATAKMLRRYPWGRLAMGEKASPVPRGRR